MTEYRIGSADRFLADGEMKRLELGDVELVIARAGDHYYAFGGNCTHYGAPLEQGLLKGHTLLCPWHHACFDIRTGARTEPPALDDLPHYPVRVDDGALIVTLPATNTPTPEGKSDLADAQQFVIVGGGAAGNAAAEELRRAGYRGKIVIVSAASTVPIDRPNLSKSYMAGNAEADWIPLRDGERWYKARDIDLRLKTRVTSIDRGAHTVQLDDGTIIQYDKLLLATGGTPRLLEGVSGSGLEGIFTLRSLADADRIIQAAEHGNRAVVIGASFIGMEVAASLTAGRGIEVTVVERAATPFEPVLGERIGRMFRRTHEQNGVRFRLNRQVQHFVGEDGRVKGVALGDETLLADFVVAGVGVRPATNFLHGAGLALDSMDHAVRVDRRLQTSDPDIYAAGDIARWDDGSESGRRIEHWRTAQQQGVVAARSMLGQDTDINRHVPFFWTNQFDVRLKYVGYAVAWNEIVYRGSVEEKDFVAFYVKDGQVLAAAGCGRGAEINAMALILREGKTLTSDQARDESFDLAACVHDRAS